MLRARAHGMTHGRACPRLPQALAYGEGGLGPAVAIVQRMIAVSCAHTTNDLTGLQRDFRRGLCDGIGAGFWRASWAVLGASWAFC